ncbi:TlpA family protein disulfide reductase [Maribacter sp. 2308TA10-17]|uniref:TlpA family protein disulfide reductase n=1 Tax=Maribacter sp. 2308TA10-17 TaxID=3386276 RepID=UPI0039BD3A14
MKFTKEQLTNFTFIIVLGIILFTPVGFHIRVFVSKIISFSPTELDVEDQVILSDYDWKLIDKDGNLFDFNNTRGKVVLVNFWATWCPPCVAEMPSLHSLYIDYADKIEFVLVTNEDQEKIANFLLKNKYDFPVYFEQKSRPISLSSTSIPTTYLIDANGKIIIKKVGAADWNSDQFRNTLNGLLKSTK